MKFWHWNKWLMFSNTQKSCLKWHRSQYVLSYATILRLKCPSPIIAYCIWNHLGNYYKSIKVLVKKKPHTPTCIFKENAFKASVINETYKHFDTWEKWLPGWNAPVIQIQIQTNICCVIDFALLFIFYELSNFPVSWQEETFIWLCIITEAAICFPTYNPK